MSFSKKLKSWFRTKKRSVIVKEKSKCVLLSLIYFEEDRYVPNCPIVTCGRQNALTQVWTLKEDISTPVDNEKLLEVIQESAKPSLPQQKEDTLPPITIPEASTLVVAVEDDKSAAEYTAYPTFIDAEVQTDQVEAEETAVIDMDTQTSSATIEDFPLHPDPVVAPFQHSDCKIRPVDNEDPTKPTVNLLSPKPAVTSAHTTDESYKDMYDKTCIQFAAMHRRVRGLISSRAVLQRENVRLVNQLERKSKEVEEKDASYEKNLNDLESEHSDNLEKMRGFHNNLLEKRNIKIAELEQTISDLNLKLDEFEDHSRTEMQETSKKEWWMNLSMELVSLACAWGLLNTLYLHGMSCIGKHESVLYIIAPPQQSEW
ncbi:hypothetical protein DAPPUDRAFT_100333 [Daphnia pulex]|uniref:Uncharacterized protein n=1 Tax=Daphnia pulex TaxID=6669 RepID=E9GA34_DAPPU|nr:hypothetical protein DAPPUDRAFT_100333 [Daphnia pulex]|eukprot:EFX83670.1 hypothetical protein DAPPUDRAFT_100333 [Daphnia pulex]